MYLALLPAWQCVLRDIRSTQNSERNERGPQEYVEKNPNPNLHCKWSRWLCSLGLLPDRGCLTMLPPCAFQLSHQWTWVTSRNATHKTPRSPSLPPLRLQLFYLVSPQPFIFGNFWLSVLHQPAHWPSSLNPARRSPVPLLSLPLFLSLCPFLKILMRAWLQKT